MKLIATAGILAIAALFSGCATPAADPASEGVQVAEAPTYEDKGELLTGSRIPQKSTTHLLKRVGGKDYKKSLADAGQHNRPTPVGGR